MATLKVVLIVLEVLLLFNLLIGVHELGHFLAAKWRGLKIERFAIWFGKPIWKKKIQGVEYALGWIPAGGYVALPQMATMEAIEGKNEGGNETPLPPVSALDKIIVAFAGPLFSFLLACAFAFVVWGVGKPVQSIENSTEIGWVDPNGPAWEAGLRAGDRILEIDGEPVTQFAPSPQSITWRIITSKGTNIAVKYSRNGEEHVIHATPIKEETKWYERKSLRKLMISPARPTVIADVVTNSPAEVAGLRPEDEIIAINGDRVYAPEALFEAQKNLTNGPLKPVVLTIRRGTNSFDTAVNPESPVQPPNAPPSFGVAVWYGNTNEALVHPTPASQIAESAGQIFATLGTVLSPKSDVGIRQLGGAVMIIRAYKNFFESPNGWRRVLWFSVILNVNLALLNLLPFPVLDGGHITLALIEGIRRRPVSAAVLQYIQTGCAILLIGFMVLIAFYDTGDWFRSARKERQMDQPLIFAPKQ